MGNSLEQFIDYLRYEKKYSFHTQKAYKRDLNFFNDFCKKNNHYNIDNCEYKIIRLWIISMIDGGNSNRTVNRKISVLRSYFNFLIKIADNVNDKFNLNLRVGLRSGQTKVYF